MVTARLLGIFFIDGPDMMRDVDRRMGIMVEAVKGRPLKILISMPRD